MSIAFPFGIVSIQTNNTLILEDNNFLALKESKLVKASFIVKPSKQKLNLNKPLIFNSCILSLDHNGSL
jgi:hypothetical protein